MISYLVATLPWTLGCLALSPNNPKAIRYRKFFAGCFFGTLVPLVYFFIQHKVHKVAGGKLGPQPTVVIADFYKHIQSTRSLSGHLFYLTSVSMP